MSKKEQGVAPYDFDWVESPADLAPYLNSLYILRVSDAKVDDIMPAYSGQLVVPLSGSGSMEFAKGGSARIEGPYVQAPLSQAQKFNLEPGTVLLGASLNFHGWAAVIGLDVDKHSDRSIAPAEVLTAELAERLSDLPGKVQSGRLTEKEALTALAEVVRDAVKPLSERHSRVISRTHEWLSSSFKPEIAELMDTLPYSERQVQRLVARFFGLPPVRLVRRYRAIRAATLLSMPELPEHLESEIREAFYDQAHMIKEIRHFTGRTPRRLMPKVDSVIKDTLGTQGYGSVDLFGGNQDEELARKRQ